MITYPIEALPNFLAMSRNHYLFVEGDDDKTFFNLLLDEYQLRSNKHLVQIVVLQPDELIRFHYMGKQEQVEEICKFVKDLEVAQKLAGFVDREFRFFEITDQIIDNQQEHFVEDRLVYSRGHSIENYLLEINCLRSSLRDIADVDNFNSVFELYKSIFESVIRLTCSLTLLTQTHTPWNKIVSSIDWKCFQLESSVIDLDLSIWKTKLQSRGYDTLQIKTILSDLEKHRYTVQNTNKVTILWYTHGHITFDLSFKIFQYCTFLHYTNSHNSNASILADNVFAIDRNKKFRSLASHFVRHALDEKCMYPEPVIRHIGLTL